MAILVVLLFFTLVSASSYSAPPPSPAPPQGFVARLIHRISPESPFFRPNLTYEDVITEGVHSSNVRDLVHQQSEAPQAPISYDYTMNYGIGSPPVMTYAIPDTGSDLIWLQCKPCLQCYKQDHTPIFDPKNSSTYAQLSCQTPLCQSIQWVTCGPQDPSCFYEISSGDGRVSSGGVISTDTFTFFDSLDPNESNNNTAFLSFPNITFGCGDFNEDPGGKRIPGIMGLRNATTSLVGQLNLNAFSYCINKDSSDNYNGWIRFGSAAVLSGGSTQLLPNSFANYHLRLEQIKVGDDYLDVANFFRMGDSMEAGFIIDSGTTITKLYTQAYDILTKEIQAYFLNEGENELPPFGVGVWEFCYDHVDIQYAPAISLVFADLEFELSFANTWITVLKDNSQNAQCLAIMRTESQLSVLGYYQLRWVNVGYDLLNNQLWLEYQNNHCPV